MQLLLRLLALHRLLALEASHVVCHSVGNIDRHIVSSIQAPAGLFSSKAKLRRHGRGHQPLQP